VDDGEAIDDRRVWSVGFEGGSGVCPLTFRAKGRYDGKVVAYMKDTAGEFDALGGEIGLLLEDVFANVLEGDLGQRRVLREAIHAWGEREEMERERTGDWRVL
jgi:hypothetical protein